MRKRTRYRSSCCVRGFLVVLGFLATTAVGQDGPVSREEFNDLKRMYDALQKKLEDVEESATTTDEVDESLDELADEIEEYLREDIDLNSAGRPGETAFLLTGYAKVGFIDGRGADSTFGAAFFPLFLWKIAPKLFFEAELEFELEDDETEVGLEYAQLVYLANDWLTIGAGKFLNPFGAFWERIHPTWINRLPDRPLGYTGGANQLVPDSQLGFQARGAFAFQNRMRLTFAVWVSNGPALVTEDAAAFGELSFDNFTDINNNKAFGTRIAFLPIPTVEIGYSIEVSQATPTGDEVAKADVLLQGLDASWHTEMKQIHGTIDVRFEYLYSNIDNVTYDPMGSPVTFDNKRTAWYLQLAYRATLSGSAILKRLEFVYRYDTIDHPSGAPSGLDEERSTIGVNYWLSPSSVLKGAYQFDDITGAPDRDVFLLQWGMGF